MVAQETSETSGLPLSRLDWVLTSLAVLAVASYNLGSLHDRLSFTRDPLQSQGSPMLDGLNAAQQAVPKGATILVRVSRPDVLDFQRNHLYVVDWPGSGYPEGFPPEPRDGRELVDALRLFGVDYVMYSYGDEAGASQSDPELRERLTGRSAWLRDIVARMFRYQDLLAELPRTTPPIFDDGKIFVSPTSSSL